jgi:hypothetical protein
VLALALTGWVAAFARLRRSALSGADDFGVRRSGHREDPRTTTLRTATFDAGRPIHSANTDGREHDTLTSRRVVGVPPNTGATAAPYTPPAEPGGAVTFVLVSTMNPDSAPRVANLLASMRAFLTTDDTSDKEPRGGSSERVVAELLVLVPDAELDWWALAAAALGADAPWGKTRVVPESRALPTPAAAARALAPKAARREARGLGYRTQMLLKLAAGALVRTPFYVTLDCDVVLRGALRAEDMLDASRRRALAQGAMGGPHAARWLSHSLDALFGETPGAAAEAAKALESDEGNEGNEGNEGTGSVSTNRRYRSFASKVASCGASATSRGVGVTPAILSAALAKRALAFLDEPSARFRIGIYRRGADALGRASVPVSRLRPGLDRVRDLRGVRVCRGDVRGDALRRRDARAVRRGTAGGRLEVRRRRRDARRVRSRRFFTKRKKTRAVRRRAEHRRERPRGRGERGETVPLE